MRHFLTLLFLALNLSVFSQVTAPPVQDVVVPPVTAAIDTTDVVPPITWEDMQGDSGIATPTANVPQGPDTTIYQFAEYMPEFVGGEAAFKKYISDSTRYPLTETGHYCNVYVYFVVEKDGSITNCKVKKACPGEPELDAEALRIISGMPPWKPGIFNNKPVRVGMYTPIRFYRP